MEIALFCNLIMGMTSHRLCCIHYFQKQITRSSLHSKAGDYTRPWIPQVGSTGGHVSSASCKGSRAHALTWASLAVEPTGSLFPWASARCWAEEGTRMLEMGFQPSNWLCHFVHGSIVFSSQGLCLFTCKSRVLDRDSMTISFFPVPILNGWPWISGASYWERFHCCVGASPMSLTNSAFSDVTLKSATVEPWVQADVTDRSLSYPHLRAGC